MDERTQLILTQMDVISNIMKVVIIAWLIWYLIRIGKDIKSIK